MEMKFFVCEHCGNIVAYVEKKGPAIVCCGEKMKEIVPNTTDAAKEKHVPVAELNGSKLTVRIGSVDHPMTEEHQIDWVAIQTREGNQRKALHAGDAPVVEFVLSEGDEVEAIYAYCNLHGLWKA